jgi:hypothetical protein
MFKIKQALTKKEQKTVEYCMYDVVDIYNDFYYTRDNIRISLRDNPEILFKSLNAGDKIVVDETNEKGIAVITGWSDDSPRKYVKILTRDEKIADQMLKIIGWNINCDLYVKVKKTSKFLKTFQRNFFKFVGDRGAEVLLCRKYIAKKDYTYQILKEKGDLPEQENIYYKRIK